MKKVIEKKVYNTETAKLIAEYSAPYNVGDFNYYEEKLYMTKSGEYFLHGKGGPRSEYAVSFDNGFNSGEDIHPLSKEDAYEWCERHLSAETLIEIFGDELEYL